MIPLTNHESMLRSRREVTNYNFPKYDPIVSDHIPIILPFMLVQITFLPMVSYDIPWGPVTFACNISGPWLGHSMQRNKNSWIFPLNRSTNPQISSPSSYHCTEFKIRPKAETSSWFQKTCAKRGVSAQAIGIPSCKRCVGRATAKKNMMLSEVQVKSVIILY